MADQVKSPPTGIRIIASKCEELIDCAKCGGLFPEQQVSVVLNVLLPGDKESCDCIVCFSCSKDLGNK